MAEEEMVPLGPFLDLYEQQRQIVETRRGLLQKWLENSSTLDPNGMHELAGKVVGAEDVLLALAKVIKRAGTDSPPPG